MAEERTSQGSTPPPRQPPSAPAPPTLIGPAPAPRLSLSSSLGGDLPCVICGYNLRGLSIRSTCPECGTAVRATILAVVDPLARELQPVRSRWLLGAGLIVWSSCALVSAILAWIPHLADAATMLGFARWRPPSMTSAITAMVVLSGFGGLALVTPHRGLPRRNIFGALLAISLYVPAAYLVWRLGVLTDMRLASPMLDANALTQQRSTLRLTLGLVLVAIVLGLRPNARVLVARSLALRSGRVDRQTLMAIALAACVVALGDGIHLLVSMSRGIDVHEIAFLAGTALIAMGSALITGGFAGSLADCLRIARAVLSPGPSLAHVVEPQERKEGARRVGGGDGGGGSGGGGGGRGG